MTDSLVIGLGVAAVFEPAVDEGVESLDADVGLKSGAEIERELGFGNALHSE